MCAELPTILYNTQQCFNNQVLRTLNFTRYTKPRFTKKSDTKNRLSGPELDPDNAITSMKNLFI